MLFLAVLIPSTAIAWLLGRHTGVLRDYARRGLAAAMVIAGVTHFTNADPFVQHMPDWVPAREVIVYVSGALEIALGIAMLLWREHRGSIGRLLAMYLVAVFPANVYVAMADVDVTGQPGGLYAWIRLPLQALFVTWALWSTTSAHDVDAVDETRPLWWNVANTPTSR
jgi:uncharacterized membrane protein